MTAADQQDPKKSGGGDEGIARQLEALDIKDQSAGDKAGEGVARRIKDYCDEAVTHLKAGRLEEAYVYANEALELDGKDAKAAALYALLPRKRLLDKANALRDEARQCSQLKDYDKAHELLTLATKWHGDPFFLHLRALVNSRHGCFDLAYVDAAEALAAGMHGDVVAELQKSYLRSLGLKVPQVIESQHRRRMDEVPAHSPRINLPNGVRVEGLHVDLRDGCAQVMDTFFSTQLMPTIPLGQLALFLNEQVQGAMGILVFRGGEGREEAMLRLLDEVTVPGRLHVDRLSLDDFFHLPLAGIKRILDGRTLRAKEVNVFRLQLPSGVDPNELLKLPIIRDCTVLSLHLCNEHRPRLPGPQPLFKTAALLEWLKQSAGEGRRHELLLTREYLSSGLLDFLNALKKDFQQAAWMHSYCLEIDCPDFDVANGLGVRNEVLYNRLGEGMTISVGEDQAATETMGHRFETVKVERLSLMHLQAFFP